MKNLFIVSLAVFMLVSGMQVPSALALTTSASSSASAGASVSAPTSFAFGKNLSFGLRNHPDVTALQQFLTDQGLYKGPITGNFFTLTRDAVRKFQSANGVSATGFFGPLSRGVANGIYKNVIGRICPDGATCPWPLPAPDLAITTDSDLRATVGTPFTATFKVSGGDPAIAYDIRGYDEAPGLSWTRTYCPGGMVCAQMISSDTITLFGTPLKAGVFNATVIARQMNTIMCIRAEGCPTGSLLHYGRATFSIVVGGSQTGSAPVIQGVKGPTTLIAGETGTWSVSASDPSNGSLSYSVDWGDQPMMSGSNAGMMPLSEKLFVQTATFLHAYQNAGTYTVTFRVRNDSGAEANSSLTVSVGGGAQTSPSISSLTPSSGVVGTSVVIIGSGFTPGTNTVHFGSGVIMNLPSKDGTSVAFAVPVSLDPPCAFTTPRCLMASFMTQPGAYNVWVSNERGSSNQLTFTVYASGY